MASVRTGWLSAALLLAAPLLASCGGPVVTAAYNKADPVDRWQAVLRANTARYLCGAQLGDIRESHFADVMVEAQRQATAALAKRDDLPAADQEVLGDIAQRRTAQERAVRDVVAQRGCQDPQIMDLIGLADRLSAGQG